MTKHLNKLLITLCCLLSFSAIAMKRNAAVDLMKIKPTEKVELIKGKEIKLEQRFNHNAVGLGLVKIENNYPVTAYKDNKPIRSVTGEVLAARLQASPRLVDIRVKRNGTIRKIRERVFLKKYDPKTMRALLYVKDSNRKLKPNDKIMSVDLINDGKAPVDLNCNKPNICNSEYAFTCCGPGI